MDGHILICTESPAFTLDVIPASIRPGEVVVCAESVEVILLMQDYAPERAWRDWTDPMYSDMSTTCIEYRGPPISIAKLITTQIRPSFYPTSFVRPVFSFAPKTLGANIINFFQIEHFYYPEVLCRL